MRRMALALAAAALLGSGDAQAALWVFEDDRGVIHVRDYRAHDGFRLYRPKTAPRIPAAAYRETLNRYASFFFPHFILEASSLKKRTDSAITDVFSGKYAGFQRLQVRY